MRFVLLAHRRQGVKVPHFSMKTLTLLLTLAALACGRQERYDYFGISVFGKDVLPKTEFVTYIETMRATIKAHGLRAKPWRKELDGYELTFVPSLGTDAGRTWLIEKEMSVVYWPAHCHAETALMHELGHVLLFAANGDYDYEHKTAWIWGSNGIVQGAQDSLERRIYCYEGH